MLKRLQQVLRRKQAAESVSPKTAVSTGYLDTEATVANPAEPVGVVFSWVDGRSPRVGDMTGRWRRHELFATYDADGSCTVQLPRGRLFGLSICPWPHNLRVEGAPLKIVKQQPSEWTQRPVGFDLGRL